MYHNTPIVRLDHQILLKSPPPQTLLAGSTPEHKLLKILKD